jgi:hypothetical protein
MLQKRDLDCSLLLLSRSASSLERPVLICEQERERKKMNVKKATNNKLCQKCLQVTKKCGVYVCGYKKRRRILSLRKNFLTFA